MQKVQRHLFCLILIKPGPSLSFQVSTPAKAIGMQLFPAAAPKSQPVPMNPGDRLSFMLCRLAVRRLIQPKEDRVEYILRLAGEHTLGTAGNFGSDERSFACRQDLAAFLQSLGLSEEIVTKAEGALEQSASGSQFVNFAYNMQISFVLLQNADLDLFDI